MPTMTVAVLFMLRMPICRSCELSARACQLDLPSPGTADSPSEPKFNAEAMIGGQAFEPSDGERHRCYSPLTNELLRPHLS